jgi:putative transposase
MAGTVRVVSIRQRLHATPEQENVLVSHCSHARFVWNLALEQASFYRTWQGSTPGSAARFRQLAEARAQFAWLGEGSSVVQQGALRDFDQAMKNWSDGVKKRKAGLPGKTLGHPTWRRVGTHEGFVVRDLEVHQLGRKWATVLIPKVGHVRFRLTRGWADVAKATSARVTKDPSGHWHVALTCLPPAFARVTTGASTGVDRGVANSIATSQGAMDHAPTLSKSEQVRFLALARRMSRQRKGSNRRNRTRTSLAKLHVTLGERRTD